MSITWEYRYEEPNLISVFCLDAKLPVLLGGRRMLDLAAALGLI